MTAAYYLHGFLSSAASSKGQYLRRALDPIHLDLLELNGQAGLPATLTPHTAFEALEACWARAGEQPMTLIGSSFGGWAAARFAELHPQKVSRLLLLNPGFELGSRWESIAGGPANLAAWRRRGTRRFQMPSSGEDVEIPYSFVEATAAECGTPLVSVPCCIIHGRHDDVVPHTLSEAFVGRQRLRGVPTKLVVVDDDHALTAPASLEVIAKEAEHLCTSDTLEEDYLRQAHVDDRLCSVPGIPDFPC